MGIMKMMVNMTTKKVTTNLPEKKENPKKTLTLKTGKVKTMKTGKVISTRKTTTSTRKTTTSTKKNMKVKDPKKMVTKSSMVNSKTKSSTVNSTVNSKRKHP